MSAERSTSTPAERVARPATGGDGAAPAAIADDYVTLCQGVRRLCEVDLLQYKRGQMERRVRSWAERRGAPDLATYLLRLRREPEELDRFLDRVTINVSQLWRNPDQWRVLASRVLPALAADGRLRAWSAGCSYGAEAYTLAAVARATLDPDTELAIRGTDIDRRMIARARDGRFSLADARDAPRAALEQSFDREDDGWRANAALRAATRFDVGDLLRMRPPAAVFDLILCRNTVIYFAEDVRDALHARLVKALRSGGVLVVGATERVADPRALGLDPIHPFTYRKS